MQNLQEGIKKIKSVLSSADVITYEFSSSRGKKFALVYVDGLVDKLILTAAAAIVGFILAQIGIV